MRALKMNIQCIQKKMRKKKKMNEKLALTIAYNILCDELDRASDELEYTEEYYQEVKNAAEKIKEMVSCY